MFQQQIKRYKNLYIHIYIFFKFAFFGPPWFFVVVVIMFVLSNQLGILPYFLHLDFLLKISFQIYMGQKDQDGYYAA